MVTFYHFPLDRSTYLGYGCAHQPRATRVLCAHGGQYRNTDDVLSLPDWGRLRNLMQLAYDNDDATRQILVVPLSPG